MSLVRSLIPRPRLQASSGQPLPWDDYISWFNFDNFPLYVSTTLNGNEETIAESYTGLQNAYRANGAVFACELVRVALFSEARFQFRQLRSGRPGDLFGTPELRILEQPSSRLVTGDMLARAMQHADFGGTGFLVRRAGNVIRQPRPDWVTIILGAEDDPDELAADHLDAELVGILYHPGGRNSGNRPVSILAEDVAVFAPIPDPTGHYGGIPWTSAITKNIRGHNAAANHKLRFFDNGATPQVVVSLSETVTDPVKFRNWVEVLEQDHKGSTNAYKTLYLGAGAKAQVVGANLEQLDFKTVQGADETLIAAASGVGAVVAQLSEGLQGSALNSGNFQEAMRRVADITMRPLWRNFAGSISQIIEVPGGSELWYDDRDIPALKDDIKSAAEVQQKEIQSIGQLVRDGFTWESAIDAVTSGDYRRLRHTGLFSVQLQPPGTDQAATSEPAQFAATEVAVPLLASGEVRCPSCDKLVARSIGPGTDMDCPRCKATIVA